MTADQDAVEITDEIAIERCVAGTLRGRHLTPAERELAVAKLFRLGYPNPEIVRRAGISLKEIEPILSRLGLLPQKFYRLEPRSPGHCTSEQSRRARHVVAARSRDADEARALMLALGLVEEIPVWITTSSRTAT